MATNRIRIILMLLVAVSIVAVFEFSPASAAIQATTVTPTTAKTAVPAQATTTITPTVAAPTATKTTAPVATATKTSVPAATATKTSVPVATATKTSVPVATATKVITNVVATATVTPTKAIVATATVTPTKVITATPTKVVTATPTRTPTVVRRSPRAGTVSTLSTAFVLQNIDPSNTATISATFYDITGVARSIVTKTVSNYRNTTVDQRSAGGGLDGIQSFQGSVVVSSTTQLAAVVKQFGGTSALGTGFRFDAYNGFTSEDAGNTIIMPQLLKNVPDGPLSYNSTVAIQNTSNVAITDATITYYTTPCSPTVQSRVLPTIPANSTYFIDLQNELTCVPGTTYWLGSATLSSPTQKVAVVVNQNAEGVLITYRGFSTTTGPAQRVLLPQILNAVADSPTGIFWGTSFLVMVADQTSADIEATFTGDAGTVVVTKNASPMALFDQRYDMTGRFFGSATLRSTNGKPIVAIVNTQTNSLTGVGARIFTSRGFPNTSGTANAFAPEILKYKLDPSGITFSTSLLVEFTGSNAPITVTYYPSDGSASFQTVRNPASSTNPLIVVDQRYDTNVPNGFTGSAVVTSSQPFAANVNYNGGNTDIGDTYGVYAAINQP